MARRSNDLFCRRLAWAAIGLATLLAVVPLQAQTPDWQIEMAKADGAYNDAVEKLAERRRAAMRKAGDAWVRAIDGEVADATRAGDDTLARNLQGKVDAARQAEHIPLERPAGIVTFGRHEYALIEERKTWMKAKEHCERLGGHLLILDNAAEEAFILSNLARMEFWVGATDLWTPGRTLSLDGKPLQGFSARLATDNWLDIENGIAWAVGEKYWNDHADGNRLAFVCEWE